MEIIPHENKERNTGKDDWAWKLDPQFLRCQQTVIPGEDSETVTEKYLKE